MRKSCLGIISHPCLNLTGQRGAGLAEALMALAILSLVAVSFIAGLGTGSTAVGRSSQEAVAQSLARRQMEYVKSFTYNTLAITYPKVPAPADYSITASVASVPGADSNIQQVTVTIDYRGDTVVTVTDFKVNR